MRLLFFALLLAGCSDKEQTCQQDTECVGGHGEFGLCLENHCAYFDRDCASAFRFDDAAGQLANQCANAAEVGGALDGGVNHNPPGTN